MAGIYTYFLFSYLTLKGKLRPFFSAGFYTFLKQTASPTDEPIAR